MLRFISLILVTMVAAYQQDLAKLPNGNSYGLTLGHPGGATKRTTALARTFYAAGQQWTKDFCMADADGDGQSNGLEMGDPCCKWSAGQTPQFTTGLSDPNSAASKTETPMPPCIMSFANPKLMCAVCVQALQLDMVKPSDNAAEFSLTSVKSCKDATQDDDQKLRCVAALIKNADQLLMDQKNAVAPVQSCMNLGLVCMAPTKAPPTVQPTVQPTGAPTAQPTGAPAAGPTAQPTGAPIPTKFPTAPPPPRASSILPETCLVKNGTVCISFQSAAPNTVTNAVPTTTDFSIMLPFVIASAVSIISILIISFALWRYQKKKQEKEALLQINDDFQALPDIVY